MDIDSLPLFMQSKVIESDNFHQFANNEPCLLGVDEAGRGPGKFCKNNAFIDIF